METRQSRPVYEAIYCAGQIFDLEDFLSYHDRIKFGFRLGNGLLLFVVDHANPAVWWLDILSPGKLPRPDDAKALMVYAGAAGASYLASLHESEVLDRYFERIGFQNIGEGLWAIKVKSDGQSSLE